MADEPPRDGERYREWWARAFAVLALLALAWWALSAWGHLLPW